MELRVTQLLSLTPDQFLRLRAIYLDSFPSYERAEFAFLTRSIAAGERWLYAATRGDTLLGFAIIVPHVARGIHLLEYFAVARAARNQGIGGHLLTEVGDAIRNTQYTIGLLLEIEPDDEGNADERALRARRLAFYQRNGAHMIEEARAYRVPLADRAGTMRMKLLWLPLAANVAMPSGDVLRACIRGILEKSYGVRAEQVYG